MSQNRKRSLPIAITFPNRLKKARVEGIVSPLAGLAEDSCKDIRRHIVYWLLPSFRYVFQHGKEKALSPIRSLMNVSRGFRKTVKEVLIEIVKREFPPLGQNTFFLSHGNIFPFLLAFYPQERAVQSLVQSIAAQTSLSLFTMQMRPDLEDPNQETNYDALLQEFLIQNNPMFSVPWCVSALHFYLKKSSWLIMMAGPEEGNENADIQFLEKFRELSWSSNLRDYLQLLRAVEQNVKDSNVYFVFARTMELLRSIGEGIVAVRSYSVKRIVMTLFCEILFQVALVTGEPMERQGKTKVLLAPNECASIIIQTTHSIVLKGSHDDFLLWMDAVFLLEQETPNDQPSVLSTAFMNAFSTTVPHPKAKNKVPLLFLRCGGGMSGNDSENLFIYDVIYYGLCRYKEENVLRSEEHMNKLQKFLTNSVAMQFALQLPTFAQRLFHMEFLLGMRERDVVKSLLYELICKLHYLVFLSPEPSSDVQDAPVLDLLTILEIFAGIATHEEFTPRNFITPLSPAKRKKKMHCGWDRLSTAITSWETSKNICVPHHTDRFVPRFYREPFIGYINRAERIFKTCIPELIQIKPDLFRKETDPSESFIS